MEDPSVSDETLAETVDAVERIGTFTGGTAASLAGFERLVGPETDSVSILDVGTGNGSISRTFSKWGRRNGVAVEVIGIDLLPAAVRHARARYGDLTDVHFSCTDLFEVDVERHFDVVHASLVLHHFPGSEALRALDKMAELSRRGVVVNDLHRHPVHWVGAKLLVPALTRNRVAIHDGPVSVLRGFRRRELVELASRSALSSATVEWRFPFRWLLVGRP
jgi:2-polyprenyl-3-methyl-5-hydroxy-6-metoxy-1,4-benzoquinol methylase